MFSIPGTWNAQIQGGLWDGFICRFSHAKKGPEFLVCFELSRLGFLCLFVFVFAFVFTLNLIKCKTGSFAVSKGATSFTVVKW